MLFTDFDLDPRVQKNVQAMKFTQPTPIQEQTIPAGLEGRDILGSAETGTGKTAAFLLPLIEGLLKSNRSRTPRALVLLPTRELALQVADHGEQLARGLPIRFVTIYGGASIGPQIQACKRGVDVVIATPGRLIDVMNRGHLRFNRLETLVLDEADRMLDIGFLPDIRRIVAEIPKDRQTLLFSATIAAIYKLAREVTREPVRVEVEKTVTPDAIEQAFYPVGEDRKMDVLEHLLSGENLASVLVFARTKRRVDRVAKKLRRNGVNAGVIHGDRSQSQRVKALEAFRHRKTRVLVATDVAARGIDVTGISHVVNYDLPTTEDDYVHRIGRTGRADATGSAWSLIAPADESMALRIQRTIHKRIERKAVEGVDMGRSLKVIGVPPKGKPKTRSYKGNFKGPARRRRA
jgi:ATP-dependent RNA helicase RhlE